MKWISAISNSSILDTALTSCIDEITNGISANDVDVLFVFSSPDFQNDYSRMLSLLSAKFQNAHIFGCSAGGVIGGGIEIEQDVALSISAAYLPDVE